jgi:tetratricopeptide (TPR) repeat protein
MIKNIFCLLVILTVLNSCNNNTEKQNAGANVPEKEKQMRALIAKYPDSLLLKENLVEYFRENSNYSQAIAETDNAIKKDTASERLWYIKATLLTENDDTLHAITAWEKTISISAKPEYIMSLGTLYAFTKSPLALAMSGILMNSTGSRYQGLFIQGLYYNNIGEKEKAITSFDQCMSIDYTNVLAYREKAIAQYDTGKYSDALKTLELAVAVKKTYDEAYYWMGRCYEKLNEKEQAEKSYRLALEIDPGYVEAKDALAKMGVINP